MLNITKELVTKIAEQAISKNGLSWGIGDAAHKIVRHALEASQDMFESNPIYAVYAVQDHGDRLLGHFTGKPHDIESFCDEDKAYGLKLEQIEPRHIESGYAAHKANIIAKRDRLQKELDELNARLKSGSLGGKHD